MATSAPSRTRDWLSTYPADAGAGDLYRGASPAVAARWQAVAAGLAGMVQGDPATLAEITARHIVRRISDTEVRLLSNLVLQVEPGALLGPLDEQASVFRLYWPLASAQSFQSLPA